MTTTNTDHSPARSQLARVVLILSVVAAFGISWWSLFTLAHDTLGFPLPLAMVTSAMLDGAAVVFGDLVRRYSLTSSSGLPARFWLLVMVGLSGWLNWQHGAAMGYPLMGQVLLASSGAAAALVFEHERAWDHLESRRVRGLVLERLPVLGLQGWGLHPVWALRTVWAASQKNLAVSLERHDVALAVSRARIRATMAEATRDALVTSHDASQRVLHDAPQRVSRDALEAPQQALHDASQGVSRNALEAPHEASHEASQRVGEETLHDTLNHAGHDTAHETPQRATRRASQRASVKRKNAGSLAAAIRGAVTDHPSASNDEVVEMLASQGWRVTGTNVRTERSRMKKKAEADAGVVPFRKGGRSS